MPPAIIDTVNAHRAALLAREQAAMQAMAQAWLGVERSLTTATEALALQMANGEEPVTAEQLMLSRRYRALRVQVNDQLHRYARYMETNIADGQRNMIVTAIEHSATAINAAATEAQIVAQFNRLPVSTVEAMVGLAGDGSPLIDVLRDAVPQGVEAMRQQLVSGIALGKNPIEVARQALRAGLGQSFTRMQALARTESLRVYRVTTLESYQNSRVVVGYKRLSARDNRVCPACLFADGQTYPIEHGFDEHVQGRCTMIPILANVPPVRFETGQEWFRSQPEATQLAILGRGRYEAWRDGRATLDDLVTRQWDDTWGGALVPTLVRNLPRR